MSTQNKISVTLESNLEDEIKDLVSQIRAKLSFLINLSDDERKKGLKFGPESVPYVEDAQRGITNFPEAFPGAFDIAEFSRDASLIVFLRNIQVPLQSLNQGISDTLRVAGEDALRAANEVYSYLQKAGEKNSNVRELIDRMSQRYKKQGQRSQTQEKPKQ